MNDITQRIAHLPPEKRKLLLERLKKTTKAAHPDKIKKRETQSDTFPLSYAQERLWFLEQLDPGNPAYNFIFGERLEGSLDIVALERALNEIVRRHEILRTSFKSVEGQPVQFIEKELSIDLPLFDLTSLSEDEKHAEVDRHIAEIGQTSFDLSQAPLLQARLLRREETVHALLFCTHHIVTDGWSIGIFSREIGTLYDAFSAGQPSPLPELPVQYADYSVWQREWLKQEALGESHSYWKRRLTGVPRFELPTDHPRPAIQTYNGSWQRFLLPNTLFDKIKELSRNHSVTLFITLLSVFKVLLFRYTNQADVVVGTPISNRNRAEIEDLLGLFLNNLVLWTDLSRNPTFAELLARVREVAFTAYEHQEIPFEKLVEELQPERDLSISPFFQVMFILVPAPKQGGKHSGVKVSVPLVQDNKTSKYDLTLFIKEEEGGLGGAFEYNTDLFDASTMQRMLEHFQELLKSVVANPEQRISELNLLTDAERQQILVHWNRTQRDYPKEKCFHQVFEAQAAETPEAVAVTMGNKVLSYRELNAQANRMAHYLKKKGIGPDVPVGICVERSVEMVVGLLGILKAGGAYVPMDPSYPKERLSYMLEDSQPLALLTQRQLRETLFEEEEASAPRSTRHAAHVNIICLDRDWEEISKESDSKLESKVNATNLAYIIYTSGSTGKPKGVAIQHANLVNFLTAMRETPGLSSEDILVAVTTLSFDIAMLELYLPLLAGARVVLTSRDEAGDGRRLREILNESGATVMQATPATWRMLLDTGWRDSNQLKMLCGGEALPRELANELLEKGSSLWNMYGPTETTIWSAVLRVEEADGSVHIGPPIGNTQIYILDPHLQPVPLGVYGEIYIGGEGLARGYLNRPDLTSEKFVPDPFSEKQGARLYRTGDLARYLPDGKIEFGGRIDHQVKIRGFRIELGEIEAVCIQHPAIQEAVVMPGEISEGDIRLVAYIKYTSHDEPTVSELRKYLKEKLPDYMVPSLFVTMDMFPLTPNGKIDRKNLPIPAGMGAKTGKTYMPPDSEMEKFIAGVWQEILGMNGFGVNDNFFELGGHSLLSMKVLYHIEKKLGLRINPREIMFKNLGQLAAFCEEELQRTQKSRSKGKLFSRIREAVRL